MDDPKEKSTQARLDSEPLDQKEAESVTIPDELPVLPARGLVLFPHVVLPLAVTGDRDVKLVNDVVLGNRIMAVAAAKDPKIEQPRSEDLYPVGCAVSVLKMIKLPDETTRILVQGISRVRLRQFTKTDPYITASVERLNSIATDSMQLQAIARSVVDQFSKLVELSAHLPDELKFAVLNLDDLSRLADVISATLNLTLEQRQEVLSTLDVHARLRLVNTHLGRELQTAELSSKIQTQVQSELDKDQREFLLRRQLKAIREELGEKEGPGAEVEELGERLKELKLPKEARKESDRELTRLERMSPQSPEYHVIRTYLDWVIALPWKKSTRDKLHIAAAEKILNEDHYDLEKVKQRILEYLAVRKLKKDTRGPILCFVGPPGTGKTSLGRSIARALGRNFVRMSLGGVRDEAEIRGHRRTYVGALPGRIIQSLRKAESNNPVFMLDEIDKLGADFRGDPSAALLEVLDPEQNFSFSDHYLDVPFDLSKVMFITTANILDTIPPPLRDRMETLELPGYTLSEKVAIARQFLIPRQLTENGLKAGELKFPDSVIRALVAGYTREAGLRNLEREIASLCRKHAADVARAQGPRAGRKRGRRKTRTLKKAELAELLGPVRFHREVAERTAEPGVTTGLAWTAAGGEILFIESTRYRGVGKLILTGKLGDVMKESAQAAISYLRARAEQFGLTVEDFTAYDVHIHVPAGAIPKDGPSAGVTIAMSLLSLFADIPARPDVAMTGEITLRGRVLPVGGIKEKILASHRAGIATVAMPKRNEKDLADVPEEAKKGLHFEFIDRVDQLLPIVFGSAFKAKTKTAKPRRPKRAKPKRRKR